MCTSPDPASCPCCPFPSPIKVKSRTLVPQRSYNETKIDFYRSKRYILSLTSRINHPTQLSILQSRPTKRKGGKTSVMKQEGKKSLDHQTPQSKKINPRNHFSSLDSLALYFLGTTIKGFPLSFVIWESPACSCRKDRQDKI
jgi:hypothetical protein